MDPYVSFSGENHLSGRKNRDPDGVELNPGGAHLDRSNKKGPLGVQSVSSKFDRWAR